MLGVKHFTWKTFFARLYEKANETDVFGNAAQVGFYFSFAFFPLVLFLLTLTGIILGTSADVQRHLFLYLADIMPPSAFELVRTTIDEVISNSTGGKLTLGVLVTLWSASAGVDSVRDALNSVYEVDEDRAWWKTKLQSLLLTLGFILLIGIALVTVTAGIHGMHSLVWLVGFDIETPWILTLIQWGCLFVVTLTASAVIYSWLPNFEHFHWVWVSPGSLIAVMLWLGLTGTFRLYLNYFNSYDKTYGSLGAVIILMLWMYLTAMAILVGGAINSVLTEMAKGSGAKEAQAGEKEHQIREIKKQQTKKKPA
jgi:membrane protein